VLAQQSFEDDDLDRIAQAGPTNDLRPPPPCVTRNGALPPLASRIRAGTVWINCHNVFDASLRSAVTRSRVGPRDGRGCVPN